MYLGDFGDKGFVLFYFLGAFTKCIMVILVITDLYSSVF